MAAMARAHISPCSGRGGLKGEEYDSVPRECVVEGVDVQVVRVGVHSFDANEEHHYRNAPSEEIPRLSVLKQLKVAATHGAGGDGPIERGAEAVGAR